MSSAGLLTVKEQATALAQGCMWWAHKHSPEEVCLAFYTFTWLIVWRKKMLIYFPDTIFFFFFRERGRQREVGGGGAEGGQTES